MLESLFNKVAALQGCNIIKRRLQHKCFPVDIAKKKNFRTEFIEHRCWLLLNLRRVCLLASRACVCVLNSSTVKSFSDSKMSKTNLRGSDQRSCVVNIYLGASAKFLHLRIRKCHISPSKTKTPAWNILERK